MTLDELFSHGKEFAKHAFELQGYVCSMCIVETSDGEHFPVMMPIDGKASKEIAFHSLRNLLKKKKAVRYVSMVEAWSYEGPASEGLENVLPVSEHPKRKEVVFVSAEDKYNSRSGWFPIVRPEVGKPYLAAFKEHPSDSKTEGLFTHLLSESEAMH